MEDESINIIHLPGELKQTEDESINIIYLPGEVHLGGDGMKTRLLLCLGLRDLIMACLQAKLTVCT